MRVKCNTCGGEYDDAGVDGVKYFHRCPPQTLVRSIRDGVADNRPLRALLATDMVTVRRGQESVLVEYSAREKDDALENVTTRPWPNHRDENVTPVVDGPGQVKAAGAGVTPIDVAPAKG